MRMTFKSLNRHMQGVINDRYSDLAKLQEQISTGKRLQRPSDDPVDVANDLKLREKLAQVEQFNRNLNDGMAFMSVTDTAMMSMNELMQRMRELAIQASSDTQSGTERSYMQKEVEQLTRQVLSIANTQYKGDYIFAGTETKIAPYPIEESLHATQTDYDNLDMVYFDASGGADIPVQLRDAFSDQPITNIIPGSFRLETNTPLPIPPGGSPRTEWVEGRDFTLDYTTGMITILSTGSNPAALTVDVSDGGTFSGTNYTADMATPGNNSFAITLDYVSSGKNVYGDDVTTRGNIKREIETGIVMDINISGDELMRDKKTGINMVEMLLKFNEDLLENNVSGIQATIGKIDSSFGTILEAQSKNGARLNRFETTLERNEQQHTETTRLFSELEDAEFAEVVSKFSLAETVYNAALSSAAKVIQPSLANFL